jgi:hypothetical protein
MNLNPSLFGLIPAESNKIIFSAVSGYFDVSLIVVRPPWECPKIIGFWIFNSSIKALTVSA